MMQDPLATRPPWNVQQAVVVALWIKALLQHPRLLLSLSRSCRLGRARRRRPLLGSAVRGALTPFPFLLPSRLGCSARLVRCRGRIDLQRLEGI